MNSQKEIRNIKIKNQLELWLFCAIIGAVAGGLVWALLKIMAVGMNLIWEWIPEHFVFPYYTIAVCVIGAFLIGVFRKMYGDYPEEMETVMAKVKTEKHYDYKNMLVMMIAAVLPLTGIIVGMCYWAGDNLKFARQHAKEYSQIGVAASLSVLFHAPLFGLFEVEENTLEESNSEQTVVPAGISSKIFIYGIAIAAATGIYAGLSAVFGSGLSGFPSFEAVEIGKMDYALILLYIIAGCVLAVFYEKTHQITKKTAGKVPAVFREVLAGICLGICGMLIPAVMFSGEEQMGVLMKEYSQYLLTNICIQFGLKGGHFFPVIFAGVCMGYGVGMLICGNAESHLVFASAIVTAALLGGTMKKPLAVTMLLFLCYPVKLFVWIFVAAAAGSKCLSLFDKKKVENKNSVE